MPPVMDRFRPPQPMSKSAIIEERDQLKDEIDELQERINDKKARIEDLNVELI
jgi:cell division protein FtsB